MDTPDGSEWWRKRGKLPGGDGGRAGSHGSPRRHYHITYFRNAWPTDLQFSQTEPNRQLSWNWQPRVKFMNNLILPERNSTIIGTFQSEVHEKLEPSRVKFTNNLNLPEWNSRIIWTFRSEIPEGNSNLPAWNSRIGNLNLLEWNSKVIWTFQSETHEWLKPSTVKSKNI